MKNDPVEPARNALMAMLDSFLPVFGAITAILAVRLFLLFAIVGAFVLAQTAMVDQTNHGMYVLIAYCGFTILPLVWLDVFGKRKG